jgi:hypothetical protein
MQEVSRRGAFVPKLPSASAKEPNVSGCDRSGDSLFIHVAQHKYVARVSILADRGDKSVGVERKL